MKSCCCHQLVLLLPQRCHLPRALPGAAAHGWLWAAGSPPAAAQRRGRSGGGGHSSRADVARCGVAVLRSCFLMLCSHPIAGRCARPCDGRMCSETLVLLTCAIASGKRGPAAFKLSGTKKPNDNGTERGHAWPGQLTLSATCCAGAGSHTGSHCKSRRRQRQCAPHSKGRAQPELQFHTLLCLPDTYSPDALRTGRVEHACCLSPTHLLAGPPNPRHLRLWAPAFQPLSLGQQAQAVLP